MKVSAKQLIDRINKTLTLEDLSKSLIQLGHEHELKDGVFDMEITPNRGDCLSVNGLLRDLNVFYDIELSQDTYHGEIKKLSIDFENLAQNSCSQITFLKLEIDKIPDNYIQSLDNYFSDLGINKINFFTDISNFLSYETGQPTHCYDAEKINGKLVLEEIENNESFETLLDKKIFLSNKNTVFKINDSIINLAGIMGGKSTACSKDTKTVIVECAYFKPEAIIGKSVKYDINSEAAHKFERGVDPLCQENVLRRFIKIVSEHSNITDMSMISFSYEDFSAIKIPFNVEQLNKIIGINISREKCFDYLTKLGFIIKDDYIEVPSYRSDINNQNGIAEEIARVIGYDNIKKSEITIPKNKSTTYRETENKLRYFLIDNGFYEVVNSPFVKAASDNAISIDNPLDSNRKHLRLNIVDSLVDNLIYNENRQKDSIKLFEISDIYRFENGLSKKRMISIVASGRLGLNYEDFSKKINSEYLTKLMKEIMPNRTFNIKNFPRDSLDTKSKSEIITLEFDIESASEDIVNVKTTAKPPREFNKYNTISEYPSSFKDISFLVGDSSKMEKLQSILLNYKSEIVKQIFIFDYYYNEKSDNMKIGFRFIFQSNSQTLTSEMIDAVYEDIINKSLNIGGISIPGL